MKFSGSVDSWTRYQHFGDHLEQEILYLKDSLKDGHYQTRATSFDTREAKLGPFSLSLALLGLLVCSRKRVPDIRNMVILPVGKAELLPFLFAFLYSSNTQNN